MSISNSQKENLLNSFSYVSEKTRTDSRDYYASHKINDVADSLEIKDDYESVQSPRDEKPNFLRRTFGPMEYGSIRGAILTLTNLSLGTGCLGLPQILSRIGFFQGISAIIILGIISYIILACLAETSQINNCYDYSALVELILGKKMQNISNMIFLLYYFMILVSYLVICKYLIQLIFFFYI